MNLSKNFIKQILITSRPAGWVIFWVAYLGGYLASNQVLSIYHLTNLILLGPILSFPIYVVNDIEDYESDKQNPRKKYWFLGGVLEKKYWQKFTILSNSCIIMVLVIPLLIFNWVCFLISLLGLFVGIGYSVPPLRFKTILGCDIITTVIGFACLFVMPISYNFTQGNFVLLLPYLLFSCLMVFSWSILCLGLDYESDKKANHKTTLVRIGNNMTFILSSLGYLVSCLILYIHFRSSYSIFLLLCSILLLCGLIKSSTRFLVFLMVIVTIFSIIAYSSLFLKFIFFDIT